MIKVPRIVIAPHTEESVGKLGIAQFAEDLSKTMLFKSSWNKHWRRKGTVTDLDPGEIMIFAFKDREEWWVIGDAVLLYDGIRDDHFECKQLAGESWKCCYHFTDFRSYSKYVSYSEMGEKLLDFRSDAHKVVRLSPDDYTRLLYLTAMP